MLVFTQISRNDHRMENAKIKLIINGSAGARSVMNQWQIGSIVRREGDGSWVPAASAA